LRAARIVNSGSGVEVAWYGGERMLDLAALRPDRPRRLRRTEYMRLVDAGVFEDEAVELLYGQLVTMSPQGDLHINVTAEIATLLIRQLEDRYRVRSHSGLPLWTYSCPEPDVAVVEAGSLRAPPRAALLVVEVAATSHAKDRFVKAPLYAQAGIANYWLVDVERLVVDVFTQPRGRRYRKVRTLTRRDTLRAVGLPRIAIPVAKILPPPADD
jgi:Uma2 family endonuclease